jgi:hypothetical protein
MFALYLRIVNKDFVFVYSFKGYIVREKSILILRTVLSVYIIDVCKFKELVILQQVVQNIKGCSLNVGEVSDGN